MQPIIEPAAIEDAEAILEIQKLAFEREALLYEDFNIPPLLQTLEEIQAEFREVTVLKATVEGRIVGSVRARSRDGAVDVARLVVHPDFQGQGLGFRLMQAIEAYFPDARCFELFTGYRSAGNLHLYDKLGYREFKREEVHSRLVFVHLRKTRYRSTGEA